MVLFLNINLMQGGDPSVLLGYESIMDITTFLPYLVCFFKDLHTRCPKKDPFSEARKHGEKKAATDLEMERYQPWPPS